MTAKKLIAGRTQVKNYITSLANDKKIIATIFMRPIVDLKRDEIVARGMSDVDLRLHALSAEIQGVFNRDSVGNVPALSLVTLTEGQGTLEDTGLDEELSDNGEVTFEHWQIDRIDLGDASEVFTSEQGNDLHFQDGVLYAEQMRVVNGSDVYRGILRAFGFWFDDDDDPDLDYPLMDAEAVDMDGEDEQQHAIEISTDDPMLKIGCFEFQGYEIPKLFAFLDKGFGFQNDGPINWNQHLPGDYEDVDD